MYKSMAMDPETKILQTELDREEYERFARIAEREGLSLKEALRRAAMRFAERHGRHDPDDPFFAAPPESDGDDDDLTATETDEYLYGQ